MQNRASWATALTAPLGCQLAWPPFSMEQKDRAAAFAGPTPMETILLTACDLHSCLCRTKSSESVLPWGCYRLHIWVRRDPCSKGAHDPGHGIYPWSWMRTSLSGHSHSGPMVTSSEAGRMP